MSARALMDIAQDIIDAVLHAYGDAAAADVERVIGKTPSVRGIKRATGDGRWRDKLAEELRAEVKALHYAPKRRAKQLPMFPEART